MLQASVPLPPASTSLANSGAPTRLPAMLFSAMLRDCAAMVGVSLRSLRLICTLALALSGLASLSVACSVSA